MSHELYFPLTIINQLTKQLTNRLINHELTSLTSAGGSPLGFDRDEFEQQLEAQGLKVESSRGAALCYGSVGESSAWDIWLYRI